MKNIFLISLTIFCAFGIDAQITGYAVGDTVLDFSVTDTYGNNHVLSEITASGKHVLIDIFFSSCAPCQASARHFSELHQKYGCNQGDLFCISFSSSDYDIDLLWYEEQFAKASGHEPAPYVSEEGGASEIQYQYIPAFYPCYAIIGPDMVVKASTLYASSVEEYEAAFELIGFTPTPMNCAVANEDLPNAQTSIECYPNPAQNYLYFSTPSNSVAQAEISVFNLAGELISNGNYPTDEEGKAIKMDIAHLKSGMYIAQLNYGANIPAAQLKFSVKH